MLRKFLLKEAAFAELGGRNLEEPVIVPAQHDDVEIIIPRYETLFPNRAEGGARKELIRNSILFAYAIKYGQKLKEHLLMLFELFSIPLHFCDPL